VPSAWWHNCSACRHPEKQPLRLSLDAWLCKALSSVLVQRCWLCCSVEMAQDEGEYALVATCERGSRQHKVHNLEACTAYSFRVRATSAAGHSDWSLAAASSTTRLPPCAPTGLVCTWLDAPGTPRRRQRVPTVACTWAASDCADGAARAVPSSYELEARDTAGHCACLRAVVTGLSAGLAGGQCGATYAVRVRAIGKGCAGTSKWSQPATVTVPIHPEPLARTPPRTLLTGSQHSTSAPSVHDCADQCADSLAVHEQAVHAVASVAANNSRPLPSKAVLCPGHLSVRTQAGIGIRTGPPGGPQKVTAASPPASAQKGTPRSRRRQAGLAAKTNSSRAGERKAAVADDAAQKDKALAQHCAWRHSTPMARAPPVRAKRRARCVRERIKRALAAGVVLAVVGGSALYALWKLVGT
jgi:hypothetical protein